MKRLSVLLLGLLICSTPLSLVAETVVITGVEVSNAQDQTRLVLAASGPLTHTVFPLEGPDRIVIDLVDAVMKAKVPGAPAGDPNLNGIRGGVRDGDDLRIVLDLKRPVRVKTFLLSPDSGHGHQLVVDLSTKGGKGHDATAAGLVSPGKARPGAPRPGRAASDLVVAIDAGHGGDDPGAVGPRGTHEKDVTLGIAKRLAALVAKEPGMRPLMIREDDRFVSLVERVRKARANKADLFVSIHADAFENQQVQGSSVFTLSRGSATSEAAKLLADRENAVDLIGGVDLGSSDDLLASVLLDMAQNATLERSVQAADAVLKNLSRLGTTHKPEVQKAGFVVLKAPDVPSLLVETAFVSNPEEEARLTNAAHQQRLAEAIMAGIKRYFERYHPQFVRRSMVVAAGASASVKRDGPSVSGDDADTLGDHGGGRRHLITVGETLELIAKRYGVTLNDLRVANRLKSDKIRVGQTLTIPAGG